jgi:hypothetical protein
MPYLAAPGTRNISRASRRAVFLCCFRGKPTARFPVGRLKGRREGFDFEGFWDDREYALKSYIEPAPSDELIASIEEELGGFRLPAPMLNW